MDEPAEAALMRWADRFGLPPWELERLCDADPAVLRWCLLHPHLDALEKARG